MDAKVSTLLGAGHSSYCIEFTSFRDRKVSIAEGSAINKLYTVEDAAVLWKMKHKP